MLGEKLLQAGPKKEVWLPLLLVAGFIAAFLRLNTDFIIMKCQPLVANYQSIPIADPGANLLFLGFARLIKFFHPEYVLGPADVFIWQVLVLAVFSLAVLAVRASVWVKLGGQICLAFIWMMFREVTQSHAIDSWAVLLMAMFLAGLANWEDRPRDYAAAVFLGVVLGYLPLMRQSTRLVVILPCAAMLGAGVLMGAANYFERSNNPSGKKFRQVLRPVLVLSVSALAINAIGLHVWTTTTNKQFPTHGAGIPLFISLGFTNNPYNISWDDDCVLASGLLIDKSPWLIDAQGQKRTMEEWRRRVAEDPALFLKGMIAKGSYLVRTFTGVMDPRKVEQDGSPIKPSWPLAALAIIAFAAFLRCALVFFRPWDDRMLILFAGIGAWMAAGVLPLLIIVPFYFGSCVTIYLALIFVLAPTLGSFERRHRQPRTSARNIRVIKFGLLAAAVGIISAASYTAVRVRINRRDAQELLVGNPIETFHELGYRYAYRFNRLSRTDQEAVINRFLAPQNQSIVFRAEPSAPGMVFRPVAALMGDQMLAVIAQLSDKWKMTLPSRVQGPRNSVLVALKDKEKRPVDLHIFESPETFLKIADGNWDGRYHMFCLPQPADTAPNTLRVLACNFKDGAHTTALVLEPLSGARLFRTPR